MPRKGHPTISKDRKAEAVALIGVAGVVGAARAVGISDSVVSRARYNPEIARLAEEKRPALADRFELAAQLAIESIIADAPNAKVRDSAQVCALVDKMLLLRGQATSITQNLSTEEKRKQLLELVRQSDGTYGSSDSQSDRRAD